MVSGWGESDLRSSARREYPKYGRKNCECDNGLQCRNDGLMRSVLYLVIVRISVFHKKEVYKKGLSVTDT